MYYCITIYMLEKWPISLSYHHIIFGLGGHVFCLLAEEHCTRWRGKKKNKTKKYHHQQLQVVHSYICRKGTRYYYSRTATGMDGTLPKCNFENLKPVEISKNHLKIT